MASDSEVIATLIGYGLDNPEWAEPMAQALGHTGEEQDFETIAALIRHADDSIEVTPELVRKLKKGSVAHAARMLRTAVELPSPQWIG